MRTRRLNFLLVILLLVTGCSGFGHDRNDNASLITLTPVDLFEGDAAKFKPFLGIMTGAFKLNYEGVTPEVKLEIEIWENGQLSGSGGWIGNLFNKGTPAETKEKEIIISVQTLPSTDDTSEQLFNSVQIATFSENDFGSFGGTTFTLPRNKSLLTQGLIDYRDPVTFKGDSNAYVWGYEATSTSMIKVKDFSAESLSMLEYALLFRLTPDTE